MRSVLNAVTVLEAVAEHQPVGVSELARLVELPKTTVQRCLETLEKAGWTRHSSDPPVRWSITARVWAVAGSTSEYATLREAALPALHRIRDTLDETVHLTALDGLDAIIIERVDSRQMVRTYTALGTATPLHGPAAGKAILAHLPDVHVAATIEAGLARFTDATLSDVDALEEELRRIREQGYAVNRGEWRRDIFGVGVPILGSDDRPVGSISISMPAFRFRDEDLPRYSGLLMESAQEVAKSLP
ncbi:IclR family transcriptional regulator [Blastococcus tunisiensis]|uniref:DNA-binding transcriptional regulator, IclR family n=1 Tax=Blastococcus tunisiensis TaxID=1798228 RepID=A0A1I1ZR27_9ACTN|nr:IclR family transcriptional regulator [Blastococcus sp. DSM 46838]SFE34234.1 DNA-binding transcriptional regulator, IclR family [Blastococcus sp. DSM 46838]